MSLKYREKEIIEIFIKANNQQLDTLSNIFDVSEKTILNDVRSLNVFLKDFSKEIKQERNSLTLVLDEDSKKKIVSYVRDSSTNDIGDQTFRQNMLLMKLLTNNSIASIALEDELFVSSSTLYSDFKKLSEKLSSYYKTVYIENSKGHFNLKFDSEFNLRIALSYFFMEYLYSDPFVTECLNRTFINDVSSNIIDVTNSFEVNFSEIDLNLLITYILISSKRFNKGYLLDDIDIEVISYSKRNKDISDAIYEAIKTVSDNDIRNTVLVLIESFNSFNGQEGDVELKANIKGILSDVDNVFGVELIKDENLVNNLLFHLSAMLKKKTIHLLRKNESEMDLDISYPFSSTIARYFANALVESKMFSRVLFDENEIMLISLYIQVSITKKDNMNQLNAVLVSGYGIAATKLLETQIIKEFPNINIMQTLSPIVYKKIPKEMFDFVLTTEDVGEECIPSFMVTLPINHLQKKELLNFIKSKTMWIDSIYPNIIKLSKNTDYKEVLKNIEFKVNDIEDKKLDVYETLMVRENKQKSSLGNMIAMPHGVFTENLKHNVYIFKLGESVKWGSIKVNCIICILINESAKSNMDNYMYMVNSLLNNKSFAIDKYVEVIDILNTLEEEA